MGLNWAIAGGGTGGHVTPALALGEAAAERGDQVLFIGSQQGLEARWVPEAGFELVTLGSGQVMGRSLAGRAMGVLRILGSVAAARRALARFDADVVLSVGGYAAMPASLAAALRRTPLVLVEPNAVPGRVNRLCARFAGQIFVGFDDAVRRFSNAHAEVRNTGIPLRRALVARFDDAPSRRTPEPPFRLFVFGGSQGAHQINQLMKASLPQLRDLPVEVVHQSGDRDREELQGAYRDAGIAAEVVAFETDMPTRYRWADLAICRAGALTVAELALSGLPALLIPYPFAADNHQAANAGEFEREGAGIGLHELPRDGSDASHLVSLLRELLAAPKRLQDMSVAASRLARPDAATRVIDTCAQWLEVA